jgi:hypothetical protein
VSVTDRDTEEQGEKRNEPDGVRAEEEPLGSSESETRCG